MTDKKRIEHDLEKHFDAERARIVMPSQNVMDSIIHDAAGVLETSKQPQRVSGRKTRSGGFMAWILGPGLSPISASIICAVFGLYLGYASPLTDYMGLDDTTEIASWSNNSAIGGGDIFETIAEDS